MNAQKRILAAALVLLFVGGLVGLAFAAKGKPPEKLPKAVVANMTAQIGDVLEAQDVEHVFIVKNEGAAELQILDVRPG